MDVQETINDVPNVLQTSSTNGPLVDVQTRRLAVGVKQKDVRADIEDRVDTGRKKREGDRRDGRVHFARQVSRLYMRHV